MKRIILITLAMLCFCAPLAGCKRKKATPDTSSDTSHELKPYQGEYPTTDDQILVSFDGESLWCVGKEGIVCSKSIYQEENLSLMDFSSVYSSSYLPEGEMYFQLKTMQEKKDCLHLIFGDRNESYAFEQYPDQGSIPVSLSQAMVMLFGEDSLRVLLCPDNQIFLFINGKRYVSGTIDLKSFFQEYSLSDIN